MGFFHNDIAVDLVTDLENLNSNSEPVRVENGLYYVRATDLWYRYDPAGVPSGSDITPTDNIGAFKVGASGSGGGSGSNLITGSVTPIGNVTPTQVNDIYIWVQPSTSGTGQKQVYYRSTGTSNTDWEAFGGTPVMWFDSVLTGNSDFVGQRAFEFVTGSGGFSLSNQYVSTGTVSASDWVQIL